MFNEVYKIRLFEIASQVYRYTSNKMINEITIKNIENRNKIIELLRHNYGWIRIPNGFEYRENFRYDIINRDILFDRHRIYRGEYEYYPDCDSKISNDFFMKHMQLFETLFELEKLIFKTVKLINEDININDNYYSEIIDDEKRIIKMVLEKGIICDTVVVKWLNLLNDMSKPVDYDYLASRFVNEGKSIVDYYSQGNDNYRKKCNELICNILMTLSVYHPMGDILNQRCSSEFTKKIFEGMLPTPNGYFITGNHDYSHFIYSIPSNHKKR